MSQTPPPTDTEPPSDAASQPRASSTGRRLLMGVGGIALALGLVYSVYWQQLATGIETGIDDWFQARRDQGWQAMHQGVLVGGFPFSLVAEIKAPQLARPGRWSWAGPTLKGEAWPWRPGQWTVLAPGRHTGSLDAGGKVRNLAAKLGFARAVVLVERGRLGYAEASVEDARVRDTEAGGETRLERLHLTAREPVPESAPKVPDRPPASLVATLEFETLALAENLATPLGRTVDTVTLDARLLGRIGGDDDRPAALAGWRDAGGIVEVEALSVEIGSLELDADGTLALDANLQPQAAFAARIRGFDEAVDKLTAARVIGGATATAAKLVLGALAKVPPGGGRREIKAPVTLQEQKLYVGPISVGRVPAVRW